MRTMSEWRRTDDLGQPVFDDDRLLAFALGLGDDPELRAAADGDEALRRRLDELHAELNAVGVQLHAAVPPEDDAYTDPLDERWAALHEFYAPAAAKAGHRGWAWWLKVLAPAAAVIAIAVGVGVAAQQGLLSTGGSSGGSSTSGSAAAGNAAGGEAAQGSSDKAAAVPSASPKGWSSTQGQRRELQQQSERSLAKQAQHYAVVVVARASKVVGDTQRFTVVRTLKGDAPKKLTLDVVSKHAKAGALHVLFLDPVAAAPAQTTTPTPSPTVAPTASSSPAPMMSPGGATMSGGGVPGSAPRPALHASLRFRFNGGAAVVRMLPSGLDLSTLRLP
jgi:hypothetical protein